MVSQKSAKQFPMVTVQNTCLVSREVGSISYSDHTKIISPYSLLTTTKKKAETQLQELIVRIRYESRDVSAESLLFRSMTIVATLFLLLQGSRTPKPLNPKCY